MISFKLERVPQLVKALQRKRREYGRRFQTSIVAAAEFLHTKAYDIIPYETGELWNTSYVRSEGSSFETIAIIAFTAPYAVPVHEDLTKAHGDAFNVKYALDPDVTASAIAPAGLLRRPEEQAKFLEITIREPANLDGARRVINIGMGAVKYQSTFTGPIAVITWDISA